MTETDSMNDSMTETDSMDDSTTETDSMDDENMDDGNNGSALGTYGLAAALLALVGAGVVVVRRSG